MQVTLDAALTHRDAVGLRRAINAALDAGATEEELVEVLFVTVTLAVHGMNIDRAGRGARRGGAAHAARCSGPHGRSRSARSTPTARGYWATFLDPTLELAPDFLEAYLAFSAAPARFGVLDAKTREFIYLAFDTSPTHLHHAGMRVHIRNALRLGATPAELAEVMALSVGLGPGTLEFAMPILDDEIGRRQRSRRRAPEPRKPRDAGLHGRTRSPLNYYVPGLECSCLGGVTLPTPANWPPPSRAARCPGERATALVAEWAIRRTTKASDLARTIAG